ncbi:DUF2239 family protein [Deinococcus maricopensis]|uniref:DUF2239 domain-containing protein n=1 Tax=Deinococcus maricopensis (strain DSM 21211 / LMG 22137 / NRRL B-23946 / LB-34) TaxID=709986 RepID=E8UAA2_DEIML|nr:DUF2239 family protein [Deinococcus maricopensis]ADV67991.1 Protein of unknown function DUF2239 [Deinococcus maricopensis DSM 21211]
MDDPVTYTAFTGPYQITSGPLPHVLAHIKHHLDAAPDTPPLLILHDQTATPVDFDLTGTLQDVLDRATPPARPRGRPKLGVTSREVSLLDRHWAWLDAQPSGASATLRRLIDDARKRPPYSTRQAAETLDRAMTLLGGNLPGYEAAARALYAGQHDTFTTHLAAWPDDLRTYVQRLAQATLPTTP